MPVAPPTVQPPSGGFTGSVFPGGVPLIVGLAFVVLVGIAAENFGFPWYLYILVIVLGILVVNGDAFAAQLEAWSALLTIAAP